MQDEDRTVTLTMSLRNARFCAEHLAFLLDRVPPAQEADHAAANLTTGWLVEQFQAALELEAASVEPRKVVGCVNCASPRLAASIHCAKCGGSEWAWVTSLTGAQTE